MKHLDPESLLFKLNSGKGIAEEELFQVLSLLQVGSFSSDEEEGLSLDDLYSYILVIGRAKHLPAAKILDRYLSSQDPETVSLVLEILCKEWGKTEEYLEQLVHFSLGSAWDHEGDVQLLSVRLLGEYARDKLKAIRGKKRTPRLSHLDEEVLRLLLSTFQEEGADRYVRQAAYYSILRANGDEWESIPSEYAKLDLAPHSADVRWDTVNAIQSLLSSSSSDSSATDSSAGS